MDRYVIVVGAGAAGLVAAERAAARGLRTLLVEKNRKPGVKILMSGGTRCNLTHDTDARGIVAAYGPPGRFLYSALAALGPADLVALVEQEGVATKVESTGKILPVSNKAVDVLSAFLNRLDRSGGELALEEALVDLTPIDGGFRLVTSQRSLTSARVIVTTGGKSYPGSGTTGDGYRWAEQLGHTIVPPRPALVPITTAAPWVKLLSGVTIPDVVLKLFACTKLASEKGTVPFCSADHRGDGALAKLGQSQANLVHAPVDQAAKPQAIDARRGSLLFAHFGLSGPVALDISRSISGHPQPQTLQLECDFLPQVSLPELDADLRNQSAVEGKKQLLSILPQPIPRRLAEALLQNAGLNPDSKAAELSKAGRAALCQQIKQTKIPVAGTRGFEKAEVTAGGISLDEVDSRTLQSKIVPGLYLAGEVLDLDGPIGGYNFQAAFSTGWLAGMSVKLD
jgi:predicted flavoprotein YhiN